MRFALVAALVVLMMFGTMTVGWIAVPVAGLLFGVLARTPQAPLQAAIAALIAWCLLLVRMQQYASFGTLLNQLGQIFPLPGALVALVALLLAMVLAASAARVAIGVAGVRD